MWSGTIELIYPSIIGWQHCFVKPAKKTVTTFLWVRKWEWFYLSLKEQTTHTHAYQSKPRETKLAKNKNKENFSCNAIEKKPNTHLLTLSSPCVCACDFNLECTHQNIPVQQPLGCQTDVWRRVPTPRGNEGETIQYETGQLTRKQNQ